MESQQRADAISKAASKQAKGEAKKTAKEMKVTKTMKPRGNAVPQLSN